MDGEIEAFDPCEALKVPQVAVLLNVVPATVRRYIKSGGLPSLMMGRCRRVLPRDVEAFLQARRQIGWRPYRRRSRDGLEDAYSEVPAGAPEGDDKVPW